MQRLLKRKGLTKKIDQGGQGSLTTASIHRPPEAGSLFSKSRNELVYVEFASENPTWQKLTRPNPL